MIHHRFHESGVTKIRHVEYGRDAKECRSITGFDANALYLWALMQNQPTGSYTRRLAENKFRPESPYYYGKMSMEWLEWESFRICHVMSTR